MPLVCLPNGFYCKNDERCGRPPPVAASDFPSGSRDSVGSRVSYYGARRRGKAFHRLDPFLKPPTILGCPILEAMIDAKIVRPVVGDVGVELRLATDRDEVGLALLNNRLR